jgi:hypothetical protein
MTYRLLVACDSNPAVYAPRQAGPCRAWLTVPIVASINAQAALITEAGWTTDSQGHRCPACTRTLTARPT